MSSTPVLPGAAVDRRRLLALAASAAALSGTAAHAGAARRRLFDTHAHLTTSDTARYPPAPLDGSLDPGALDNPVTIERLLELMDQTGVDRAVVVQRLHVYGYDNSYVVDAAARHPERLVAVCGVNGLDPKVADSVQHWIGQRGGAGIRMTEPRRGADPSWFAGTTALHAWEAAAKLGASVCLHLYQWNRLACLAALPAVLDRFPETPVVIDHLSNIASKPGDYGVDAALLAVARRPNVYLKLSTINFSRWSEAGVEPAAVLGAVVGAVGANRIMWGSDHGNSREGYAQTIRLAEAAVPFMDETARARLFYDVAHAVYGRGAGQARRR